MSLKQRLIEQITLEGPITVAEYMARCLLDPRDGYYTRNVALGEDGDFITAPMISQLFGEMIGVWAAEVWYSMASPRDFRLVEVGGGDGTLMSDVLRVFGQVAGLIEAARITSIEPSPILREKQSCRRGDISFLSDLAELPTDLPVIIIANEVLDCLPARQFVKTPDGWRERLVGVRDGELAFGLAGNVVELQHFQDATIGEIAEMSVAQAAFMSEIGQVLRAASGAALLIDYGRDRYESGNTLQAVHRHQKRNSLESPGEHDLTVWANLQLISEIFRNTHVKYSAISYQSLFLERMGVEKRHQHLLTLHPGRAATLKRQYNRLISPDQMGTLFKVAGLAFPGSVALPGLAMPPQDT